MHVLKKITEICQRKFSVFASLYYTIQIRKSWESFQNKNSHTVCCRQVRQYPHLLVASQFPKAPAPAKNILVAEQTMDQHTQPAHVVARSSIDSRGWEGKARTSRAFPISLSRSFVIYER